MTCRNYLFLFFLLSLKLHAQELKVFNVLICEQNGIEANPFVSLSEIYPFIEHQDSLAIPDLNDLEESQAKQFEYIKLSSKYRQHFLAQTNISETDKVFIYSYEKNKLISFPVKSLDVVAHLNIYGADWPYSQFDYLIGFEIDKASFGDLAQSLETTLVYVGKKSPFIQNKMNPVIWQKTTIETGQKEVWDNTFKTYLKNYSAHNIDEQNNLSKGNLYSFERNDLSYYIQDILVKIDTTKLYARYFYVINKATKDTICHEVYLDHESASPAPLNIIETTSNIQWTGELFKDMPSVILGFEYVSFGCPRIKIIAPKEKDIYILCDNRH